jgi:hypothetical protein
MVTGRPASPLLLRCLARARARAATAVAVTVVVASRGCTRDCSQLTGRQLCHPRRALRRTAAAKVKQRM